ncbi:dTDP-4-dehydrorhamnose 3,5-epimerase [Paenibacillus sp. MWE-103]|uniref:dTDP-4-dehydrorhamnose 3,5-epimerase n=1 Tax=Paenibacillus artemisiicola TaxID=1172618 RepID=A0ABS3WG03_9BACL|nr:dTDP-4-dehydrorhamnose 3,5-epimerase [Paenibacillus artemisiicola]MBO7747245.1 dTDP-4-dehydrorhamnose 3,5-epimerase [Paenibacillus artemisiicola]
MRFAETPLPGAYLIEPEPVADGRGFFVRTYCEKEFAAHGIAAPPVQCNVSYNHKRGTVRGMHFQRKPFEEKKLVRCTQGAIYDVIVDIRPDSPAFGRWFGVELTGANQRMLYIPEGFAHGFQTLEDETAVFYQMSEFFAPEASEGVRWDDPAIGIQWPLPCAIISEKDAAYPALAR